MTDKDFLEYSNFKKTKMGEIVNQIAEIYENICVNYEYFRNIKLIVYLDNDESFRDARILENAKTAYTQALYYVNLEHCHPKTSSSFMKILNILKDCERRLLENKKILEDL